MSQGKRVMGPDWMYVRKDVITLLCGKVRRQVNSGERNTVSQQTALHVSASCRRTLEFLNDAIIYTYQTTPGRVGLSTRDSSVFFKPLHVYQLSQLGKLTVTKSPQRQLRRQMATMGIEDAASW